MFTLNCKGRLLSLKMPLVMGIINVTPDSFYSGSRMMNEADLMRDVEKMLNDGVDIIDIGGQSTRPDSLLVSEDEELRRVVPIIEVLLSRFPDLILSIDTFYSRTAKESVQAGVCMVNDVSGGSMDAQMISTVGGLGVPYICMHMKGTPQTMKQLAQYDDLVVELVDYFVKKIEECKQAGINDIIIDPGFGFAKNIPQNFELLRNLRSLSILEKPVLAGLSRKSTVYKTLGITAQEALNGTTVLNTIALLNGANLLRVHDVKEAKEAIRLVSALSSEAL